MDTFGADEVAAIGTRCDSPRRVQITQAVCEIDQRLMSNPRADGESRSAGRRILIVAPLALLYRIDSEEVVRVLNVWEFQTDRAR